MHAGESGIENTLPDQNEPMISANVRCCIVLVALECGPIQNSADTGLLTETNKVHKTITFVKEATKPYKNTNHKYFKIYLCNLLNRLTADWNRLEKAF